MVGTEGCTYTSCIGENTHGQKKWEKLAGMTRQMQTRVYDVEVSAVSEIFWSFSDVLFTARVDISRRAVRPCRPTDRS